MILTINYIFCYDFQGLLPKQSKQPEMVMRHLKQYLPSLHNQLELSMKEANNSNNISKDALYLFASSSVPVNTIKDFILYASLINYYYKTDILIVFQGPTDITWENHMIELSNDLSQYDSKELFLSNFKRKIDPAIFKQYNISSVPAIAYAKHNGNSYPSKSKLMYLARGDIQLIEFFALLQEKDKFFKNHFNLLKNY